MSDSKLFIDWSDLPEEISLYRNGTIPSEHDKRTINRNKVLSDIEVNHRKEGIECAHAKRFPSSDGTSLSIVTIDADKYRVNKIYGTMIVKTESIKTKVVESVLEMIIRVVESKYGRHRFATVDEHLELYYPKIIIKNSMGLEHEIVDLVVKVPLNVHTGKISGTMRGRRLSVTRTELRRRYHHSHLPIIGSASSDEFCLGNSALSNMLMDMQAVSKAITEEGLELLLFQIDCYLEWESIEGVPFTYISNMNDVEVATIRQISQLPLRLVTVTEFSKRLLSYAKEKGIPLLQYRKLPNGGKKFFVNIESREMKDCIEGLGSTIQDVRGINEIKIGFVEDTGELLATTGGVAIMEREFFATHNRKFTSFDGQVIEGRILGSTDDPITSINHPMLIQKSIDWIVKNANEKATRSKIRKWAHSSVDRRTTKSS